MYKGNDTIIGVGFECKEDLSKHLAKKTTSDNKFNDREVFKW